MIKEVHSIEDNFFGRAVRVHVREFAALFALIAVLIGLYLIYKYPGSPASLGWISASAVLLFFGIYAPRLLYPIWKGWMIFAEKLGHLMTWIILSLMYYLVLTPTGLGLRMARKEVLNIRFREASLESYWIKRDPQDWKRMEKQF